MMHDFNEMLLLIYNVEEMKMQFIDERLLFLMMNRLYLEIKMDLTKDLLMILELLHFGEDGILELLHFGEDGILELLHLNLLINL